MVFLGSLLFIASIFAIPSALAAICYGNPNPGFSVAQFQEVAAQVCNEGPNAQQNFGTTPPPTKNLLTIEGSYSGSAKLNCWVRNS